MVARPARRAVTSPPPETDATEASLLVHVTVGAAVPCVATTNCVVSPERNVGAGAVTCSDPDGAVGVGVDSQASDTHSKASDSDTARWRSGRRHMGGTSRL